MSAIRNLRHLSLSLLPQCAHAVGLMAIADDPLERKSYRGEIKWVEVDETDLRHNFTLFVHEDQKRILGEMMDDLWRMGIRPSGEYHGTAGQLGEAHKHIEDLRTIAFHALKITPTEIMSQRRI